jgi:hypothetical protein
MATPSQTNNVVSSLRAGLEQLDRTLYQLHQIQDYVADLGIGNITNADLTGDNAGLQATDIVAAYNNVVALLTEDTAARRASRHKISHGNV